MSGEITTLPGFVFHGATKVRLTRRLLEKLVHDVLMRVDFGAIQTRELQDKAISFSKLSEELQSDLSLGNGSVTGRHLVESAVTTAKLAGSIIGPKLADGAVESGNFVADAVTAAKLADDAVATAAIKDANVTTAKLADAGIVFEFPTGAIVPWAAASTPSGFLVCDGSGYTAAEYPALWAAIGTEWGNYGGAGFNVPDLRGRFLRGDTDGTGVATVEDDEIKSHHHDYKSPTTTYAALMYKDNTSGGYSLALDSGDFAFDYDTLSVEGGSESRPKNAYVKFLIKT